MPREVRMNVSLTEIPHFRRLVEFVEAVEQYAYDECDLALKELVEDCRTDLLGRMED